MIILRKISDLTSVLVQHFGLTSSFTIYYKKVVLVLQR